MVEYTIRDGMFIQAQALLEQLQREFSESGLVDPNGAVYTMFPDIQLTVIEQILAGDIKITKIEGGIRFFVKEEDLHG